jgi:hypothetical protein
MAFPNNGLINETNRQYYAGAQGFFVEGPSAKTSFNFTFDTEMYLGSYDPDEPDYALNNFKLYYSSDGLEYDEYTDEYEVTDNVVKLSTPLPVGWTLVCQLKTLTGGNYGDYNAYGTTVEENYGGYSYIKLDDIINNFLVAYVGQGKLIPDVKRTDVMFHAKRAMQEFSYDILKSVKSQELTVPPSLSVILPQDYVNYVKISWIDNLGIKHPIYPTNLTISPKEIPIQDNLGIPTQSNFDDNLEGTSLTEARFNSQKDNLLIKDTLLDTIAGWAGYDWGYGGYYYGYGRQYGLDPQYANFNGTYHINDREGKISFSSDLVGMLVILEYISDGLAYDLDTRVPKLAEEAMYAYILHSLVSTRIGYAEYTINRLRQDKFAKMKNAKIRLSNIKIEEIAQIMRGKSKWIKH